MSWTWLNSMEDYLQAIRDKNKSNEDRIKLLEEENRKLKEENYKDEQLSEMKQKLEKMQKDYWRGFPISEEEEKAIEEWKDKHEEEVHGLKTLNDKIRAGGCIGGRYSYCFVPTSIGVIGKVVCSCGAEFEFSEI